MDTRVVDVNMSLEQIKGLAQTWNLIMDQLPTHTSFAECRPTTGYDITLLCIYYPGMDGREDNFQVMSIQNSRNSTTSLSVEPRQSSWITPVHANTCHIIEVQDYIASLMDMRDNDTR